MSKATSSAKQRSLPGDNSGNKASVRYSWDTGNPCRKCGVMYACIHLLDISRRLIFTPFFGACPSGSGVQTTTSRRVRDVHVSVAGASRQAHEITISPMCCSAEPHVGISTMRLRSFSSNRAVQAIDPPPPTPPTSFPRPFSTDKIMALHE